MNTTDRQGGESAQPRKRTFKELGLQERRDLQGWIVRHPSCLGKDLLIVQEES